MPYPPGSPSLLGNVYMSVQDGGKAGIIGATRNYGLSAEEALQEIGREVKLAAIVVVAVVVASWFVNVERADVVSAVAFSQTSTAFRLLLRKPMMLSSP